MDFNEREVSEGKDDFDLEAFVNISLDWICVAGFDGYFRKVNDAVCRTLGYTREELFAKPISSFMHPDDRELTAKRREKLLGGEPLHNYENRYITKSGNTVWLTWTSVAMPEKQLVFAVAKNITEKKLDSYRRLKSIEKQFNADPIGLAGVGLSEADKLWLQELEAKVASAIKNTNIKVSTISDAMAMSERQLYRRLDDLLQATPNNYIRGIRLKVAREAIESGKCRTIAEVAFAAGFKTPSYFRKVFAEHFGYDVNNLFF
ncbi:PAS domain S-box protein [Pedobacter faecalis]|uniref:PAS domain S-box protein n=1 Tax=Pedobacter faecalis TaxID=3041495 RepID=UPI00254D49AA|nr:PAS domain S-box protein [Pedobacter sp. ELA7]